jgi:hypothetical protein
MLWHSNWAHVEHRAGTRQIANHATDHTAAAELNRSWPQYAIASGRALVHGRSSSGTLNPETFSFGKLGHCRIQIRTQGLKYGQYRLPECGAPLDESHGLAWRFDGAMPRDPFVREKFTKERTAARKLAAEYLQRFPKDRYQTEVETAASCNRKTSNSP